jgi:hypothetical protein
MISAASVIFAIMASAVVVLSGLVALTRSIWRAAQDLRDNKTATQENTVAIGELNNKTDGRISSLETRMTDIERGIRGNPYQF